MSNTGYDHDRENFARLFEEAQPYERVCGAGDGLDEFDPTGWLNRDYQRGWPSCVGHGGSTTCELVNWFQTGEQIQLSRQWMWVMAQKFGGMTPSVNRGATIYGCVKALKEVGIPREELAPYTYGDYYREFSGPAEKDAASRLIRSSYLLKDHEDCLDFLKGGVGGIITGLPWGRGWHCTSWCGFTREGDIIEHNSHRGDERNVYSPREVQRFCDTRGTVLYGVSDLTTPELRTFDHRKVYLT